MISFHQTTFSKKWMMCSREELKKLLYELLYRLDQVAYLGARTQFKDECNHSNSQNNSGYNGKSQFSNGNIRFENILRFQKAYIRYFVFASDPYTEFIVPLTSSSLALFITNILSRESVQTATVPYHTSRSIIEFLQVSLMQPRCAHTNTYSYWQWEMPGENNIEHMYTYLISDYTKSCGWAFVVALQNRFGESD